MSVEKLLLISAVPLWLARLQRNSASNFIRVNNVISSSQSTDRRKFRLEHCNRKTEYALNEKSKLRMIKTRNKIVHRKIVSQVTKEKAKLQLSILQQQIEALKIENTKLSVENKDLKSQFLYLEEERHALQRRLEDAVNLQVDKSCGETLQHALLVNIPRLKEWVLTQIWLVTMKLLEELMDNLQLKQVLALQQSHICQVVNKTVKSALSQMTVMKHMMCLSRP